MMISQMGAASETVDTKAFARDLELLFDDLNQLDADMVVEGASTPDGQTTVAAGIMVDDAQINDLLLNVVRTRVGAALRKSPGQSGPLEPLAPEVGV